MSEIIVNVGVTDGVFQFPTELICYSKFIRTMDCINIEKPYVPEQEHGGASKSDEECDNERDDECDGYSGEEEEEETEGSIQKPIIVDIVLKNVSSKACELMVQFLNMNKNRYIERYNTNEDAKWVIQHIDSIKEYHMDIGISIYWIDVNSARTVPLTNETKNRERSTEPWCRSM